MARPNSYIEKTTGELLYEGYPRGWSDPENDMTDATRDMVLKSNAILMERARLAATKTQSAPQPSTDEPSDPREVYNDWRALSRHYERVIAVLNRLPLSEEVAKLLQDVEDGLTTARRNYNKLNYTVRKRERA